eukprot:540078-Pyramimonas_sp.AAC.1
MPPRQAIPFVSQVWTPNSTKLFEISCKLKLHTLLVHSKLKPTYCSMIHARAFANFSQHKSKLPNDESTPFMTSPPALVENKT